MAMPIDVTFIIAAFNSERTIVRAVESALAQDGVGVEVIVVDDCSGDATARAALDLASDRVRVIRLDDNRGPGGARNAGLDAARGRWIAVLDADDAVYPDRMARLIRRAEAAGADIAVDNLDVVDERTGSIYPMFAPARLTATPELTLEAFVAGNHLFEDTFSLGYMKPVVARDLLDRHALRYIEALRIGEDYVFLASALARGGRCVVEPLPGYAYHSHGGSISSVLELGHVEAMLRADEIFLRDHALDVAARAAQLGRTRSLRRAASYLSLVGHLKDHAPIRAAAAAIGNPAAVGLLRMPLSARWRRLTRNFRSQGQRAFE
jgi:succinoglycan biosynthesis protein ExoO